MSYAETVVVNQLCAMIRKCVRIMVCYAEPVVVNHDEIMNVKHSEIVVVNHDEVCLVYVFKSWCVMLCQCL